LILADDICVFCSSMCGVHSVLDGCQAYAEFYGLTFICIKTQADKFDLLAFILL